VCRYSWGIPVKAANFFRHPSCVTLVLLSGLCAASKAGASSLDVASETTAAPMLEEVVVTATRRALPLQDVPMSISAFSDAAIERSGFLSIQDWGNRLPNLTFQADDQSRTDLQTSIQVRGVSGAGTTGFYIDDSPLIASLNPRVFELDRIEVLRGPQGTLYGARSMGGTVRFITKQPDLNSFEGYVDAQVSGTAHGGTNSLVSGVANLPVISGKAGLRLLGYAQDDSGWLNRAPLPESPVQFPVQKGFNTNRYVGGQISALISLDDGRLTITPRFLYQQNHRGGRSEADYSASDLTNYRLFNLDESGGGNWRLSTLTVRLDRSIGTFTSATSYFQQSTRDAEDGSEVVDLIFGLSSPTPAYLTATDKNHVFSQEFRYTSAFAGPVHLTAGLFYQGTRTLTIFPVAPMPPVTDNLFQFYNPQTVTESAAYAEGTIDLTSKLSAVVGARYFHNRVSFFSETGGLFGDNIPYTNIERQSGVNPKYGLQYHIDQDRMIYADAAKGYRIGGGNTFSASGCQSGLEAIGLTAAQAQSFASDSLWSYEGGFKSSWLDRRLTFNAAAFYIDWKNLQQVLGLGSCGYQATVNIGSARSEGGEMEFAWKASRELEFALSGGYTNAVITGDGGLSGIAASIGSPVQNVPHWTISAAADYDKTLFGRPAFFHVDYGYIGSSYDDRNAPRTRPSYALVNLRGGIQFDKWKLSLFAKNLTDKAADLGDVPPMVIQYPGRPRIATVTPRTVGIEARVSF